MLPLPITPTINSFIALILNHRVHKDFTKIDRAFFTINGYLGITFLGFIILEKVVS